MHAPKQCFRGDECFRRTTCSIKIGKAAVDRKVNVFRHVLQGVYRTGEVAHRQKSHFVPSELQRGGRSRLVGTCIHGIDVAIRSIQRDNEITKLLDLDIHGAVSRKKPSQPHRPMGRHLEGGNAANRYTVRKSNS